MFAFTKLQKAKATIKKQFETYTLLQQEYSKQYSTQELNDLNQAQIQTSLNQLYLVNQALRKAYQLTDSSYKLAEAPGIVYQDSNNRYKGSTIPLHGLLSYINNYGNVKVSYLSHAKQFAILKQIAKQNAALSDLLGIHIPPNHTYIFEFHQYIKNCKENLIIVKYFHEIELPLLEALASYHKKDIVLLS